MVKEVLLHVLPCRYKLFIVLDFQRNASQRRCDNHRERRWLSVLVLSVGVAFLLIGWIRNPSFLRWLDAFSSPVAGGRVTAIDNRLETTSSNEKLAADEFLVAGRSSSGTSESPATYFADLRAEEFEPVRDDTPSSRDDRAVSMHLLDILQRTDLDALQKHAIGPVSYAQLFQQSDQYRGQLVSQSGIVRRANWLALPANKSDISGYYQLWLWPFDNPISPILVYCLELPKGFPTGMEIAEQVEVTGFFLKRCAYAAADTARVAPEILAKTVVWDRRAILQAKEPAETWPISVVVCVSVVVALFVAGVLLYRTRPRRPELSEQKPNFDALTSASPKEDANDELH